MHENNRVQEGSQIIMTDNEMPQQDASTPQRTIRLKPIQPIQQGAPASPASAESAPAPAAPVQHAAPTHFSANPIPGAKQTIRLRPSTMSGIGHPSAGQGSATDTSRLSKRTIKLTASRLSSVPADTIRMVKADTGVAPMPAASSAPAEPAAAPTASPSVPNDGKTDTSRLSRRTIKLTASHAPAAAPAPQNEAPSASQPTIKLNAGAAPTSSQPTIKLNANGQAPQSQAQRTIKLNTGTANKAGQTIRLGSHTQPSIQINKPEGAAGEAASGAPSAEINPVEQLRQSKAKAAQGSMPFFLTSLAALLILGFLCFVLYAQYANLYQGAKISIPLP